MQVGREKQICEKREKKSNKFFFFWFGICVRTIPNLEQYCSLVPNVLAFKTPAIRCFLVFGVSNAKYLAFGTPNGNALIM